MVRKYSRCHMDSRFGGFLRWSTPKYLRCSDDSIRCLSSCQIYLDLEIENTAVSLYAKLKDHFLFVKIENPHLCFFSCITWTSRCQPKNSAGNEAYNAAAVRALASGSKQLAIWALQQAEAKQISNQPGDVWGQKTVWVGKYGFNPKAKQF